MLLYKYRGGDKNTFERDLKSLENNFFWGANFEQLNDPCETLVVKEKFYEQANSLKFIFEKKTFENFNKVGEALENLLSLQKKIGIYSLSQTYKDELLWAHYGNSHKGFCIEYNFDILFENFNGKINYFPITYSDNPPNIGLKDIAIKSHEIIEKMAGYKSKRWAYEKEYRIITDFFGIHSYNHKALKSIYFGLRMKEEEKSNIIDRLKGRGIEYYQMTQLPNSYSFNAQKLSEVIDSEVRYLRKVPSTRNHEIEVSFEIIKIQNWAIQGRGDIEILLDSKISKNQLKWLAKTLKKNLFHQFDLIIMLYYVKNQDKDFAWATSNYKEGQYEFIINEI